MKKSALICWLCVVLTVYSASGVEAKEGVSQRQARIKAYMDEFCSRALLGSPTFEGAIRDVLMRVPENVFLLVTDRDFPALFTEYYSHGNARLSNSSGVEVEPGDPPTFSRGIWIVKLNFDLEKIAGREAIEAIVAHELAHRVLKKNPGLADSPDAEKSANHLIQAWGFGREFKAAKRLDDLTKI